MAEENTNENQYVVLARKYRPQNFEDLLGQDALVQTLTNAIQNNRLHHAYILTGIRGVGKPTPARLIARALKNALYASAKNARPLHRLFAEFSGSAFSEFLRKAAGSRLPFRAIPLFRYWLRKP